MSMAATFKNPKRGLVLIGVLCLPFFLFNVFDLHSKVFVHSPHSAPGSSTSSSPHGDLDLPRKSEGWKNKKRKENKGETSQTIRTGKSPAIDTKLSTPDKSQDQSGSTPKTFDRNSKQDAKDENPVAVDSKAGEETNAEKADGSKSNLRIGAEPLTTIEDTRQDSTQDEAPEILNPNATKSTAIDSMANEAKINRTIESEPLTTIEETYQNSTGKATSKSLDSNATKPAANDFFKANEETNKRAIEPKKTTATKDTGQRSYDTDFFFAKFRKDDPTADFIMQDAFSASWWQSRDNFLRYKNVELRTPSAEGASFEVFRINEENMRVTRDWMDLNVEHMSKWWKIVLDPKANKDSDNKYHSRILQIFEDYVYSSDRLYFWDRLDSNTSKDDWLEVSQSTIAVIAFMPNRGPGGDAITKWSLAATLMSLVQLGVGRIIISGVESVEKGEHYVQEAWKEVANATKDWKTSSEKQMTSIGFCECGDAHNDWKDDSGLNIPKTSLRRLRHVFLKQNMTEEIRECWGGPSTTTSDGDVMDRWQYVFLGEPDLILNTRPSVIAKLGKALKDGGVLAPHRLQPTPHDADFGYQNWTDILEFLIPNVSPKLDEIIEIDHYLTSPVDTKPVFCCDDGNEKPYKEIEKCGNWWWQCGFSFFNKLSRKHRGSHGESYGQAVNGTHLSEAYKRTLLYPFVRLKRGTGVIFAGAEQGRRCLPSNGTCAMPNRPTSS